MNVSIIVPIYNVEKYVERCLNSVSAQTYLGEIECVLVDDCGKDDSVKKVLDYIENDHSGIHFRVVHHAKNRGLSAARNTGIRESTGDWLFFLDSDDWITPDCVRIMMDCISQYPGTEMVLGNYQYVGATFDWKFASPGLYTKDFVQMARYNLIYPMAPNKLLSRAFLVSNDLFFAEGLLHEDILWTMQLSCYLHQMVSIPEKTYCYFVHKGSISTNESYEFHYEHLTDVKLRLIDFAFLKGFKDNEPLYKFCTDGLYNYILEPIAKGNCVLAEHFYEKLHNAPFWTFKYIVKHRRNWFEVMLSLHRYLPYHIGFAFVQLLGRVFLKKFAIDKK